MQIKYIPRSIEKKVTQSFFKKKALIIYGPRQAGKTTLVQKIIQDKAFSSLYLNADEASVRDLLGPDTDVAKLKDIVGTKKILVIDEAQRLPNIGLTLKILVDNFPFVQTIATGSSSFELAQKVSEPLTGRNFPFFLPPFTLPELLKTWGKLGFAKRIDEALIYGCFPRVVKTATFSAKEAEAKLLAEDYLYKDILQLGLVRSPETIRKVLIALSLQIGQEVSLPELANLVGVSKQLIASYLEILEKAFVIFHLPPFSRNLRKELGKLRKIYFYDLGIRNALIDNFNPLEKRADVGQLWENFVVAEYKKRQSDILTHRPLYFWRTYDQQEIDLVWEEKGQLTASEIKWQKTRTHPPAAWAKAYPNSHWQTITRENFEKILLPTKATLASLK